MANRVEIGESVENAIGLNITGASVVVRFHGGAQAPVYNAQNGGTLLPQPLSTVNGKIGADSPSGAWVASGDYDLDVTFGSDTLTFFWPAAHDPQFVTTLPAGAGTSAPEDGEMAMELYDAANGGAWLRRYRAAVTAWDMVGGPPPSGAVLPVTPRVRQEFYLTGGSPTIQHMRYNGATWDYVGTPPMVPVTGSPLTVLDTGQVGQLRGGHQLALADFSTLAGLPTVPVGLFNLGSITNLGSGGNLVNKGTVTFTNGIEGVANAAALFTGSSAQALYIVDTGAADPFRLKAGSWGCWMRTAKRGTAQRLIAKYRGGAGNFSWALYIDSATNSATFNASFDGTATGVGVLGVTDVCDDRWHHVAATFDGATAKLYIDGVVEDVQTGTGAIFPNAMPVNIGASGADAGTIADFPHFGRIDEAFISTDILNEDQMRLIAAAKIPHGYAVTPRLAAVGIRRRRRGAALVSSDFPSQPIRLHNFAAGVLTDLGSGAVALTATGAPLAITGPDGALDNAYNFVGASAQSLGSTDTGLPSGTASRSYGAWFKTTNPGNTGIIGWGTNAANDARLADIGGVIQALSGGDAITGPFIADGLWHFAVVTEENAPVDGVKRKLYLDGRLVGTSTVLTSLTLAGAGRFRIGSNPDASSPFTGQVGRSFVHSVVLTPEQIAVLYQKSSQALAQSPQDPGARIEGFDATSVYAMFDIDSNYQVDMAVAS